MSHVSSQPAPPADGSAAAVDAWYRAGVCRVVCRMQDNIGYLVTFAHSLFAPPGRAHGSRYSRVWDVPAFSALLLGMPLANVVTFVSFWGLPLVAWVNLNHGNSMRGKLCQREHEYFWVPAVASTGVVAFVFWLALKALERAAPAAVAPSAPDHARFFAHRTLTMLSSRFALVVATYSVLIVAVMGMEIYDFRYSHLGRDLKCACVSFYDDFSIYAWSFQDYQQTCASADDPPLTNNNSFAVLCVVVFAALLGATALIAVCGAPSMLGATARTLGPLLGVFGIAYLAQWRVFGPVTQQRLVIGALPYDAQLFKSIFLVSCGLAVAQFPLSHELPRTLRSAQRLNRVYD